MQIDNQRELVTVARQSRSAITFALIFTKHIALRDLMTMLKHEPVRSLKCGTYLAKQRHWSCAQGVASRVIKRPEEERQNGYE